MRGTSKLALMGLAALLACAAAATSALAVSMRTGSATGPVVGVGTVVNTSGTMSVADSFTVPVTITCSSSVSSRAETNAAGGAVASLSMGAASFTSCADSLGGSGCGIQYYAGPTAGAPLSATNIWYPGATLPSGFTGSPHGGMEATSTTTAYVAPGDNGYVEINNCVGIGSPCDVTGTLASDGHNLKNAAGSGGDWTNPGGPGSPPQLVLNNAPMKDAGVPSSGCGGLPGVTWTMKFTYTDSSGHLIYLGT